MQKQILLKIPRPVLVLEEWAEKELIIRPVDPDIRENPAAQNLPMEVEQVLRHPEVKEVAASDPIDEYL